MQRRRPRSINGVPSHWRSVMLVAVLALIPAAPAMSQDETPAAPTVEATMHFVVGSSVDFSSYHCNKVPESCCGNFFDVPAVLNVTITGLDGTYQIFNDMTGHGVADGRAWSADVETEITYPHEVTNYDGTCGCGSCGLNGWAIWASNGDDPAARTVVGVNAWVTVYDEDGVDVIGNWPDADIVTRGRWRTSYCDCWIGGTVLRTRQRGARMTYTAEVLNGEVIAIVMPMAPNRGEARIKLDGVNQGRIDTYAPTSDNRIVTWQTPPLEAGEHTVQIINLATEGRPRIDVDAFLTKTGGIDD